MYRVSKDKLIGKIWKQVDPKFNVPQYNILITGLFLTLFVLFFDISVLSQLISMTTLLSYVLIMSIVVFKKMRKKKESLILQGLLFLVSLAIGFLNCFQVDNYLLNVILWALAGVLIIAIVVLSIVYPDTLQSFMDQ